MKNPTHILAALLPMALTVPLAAAEPRPRNIEGIQDNSFLVEEAYNQEAGVVQHIATVLYQNDRKAGPDDHVWELALTEEWPLWTQTHQLGFTLPYLFSENASHSRSGLGDVLINYRFQAHFDKRSLTAFSPRLSLILPTGDADRGFGEETLGYQVNLPFSTTLGDCWFAHLNAGATFLPDAASAHDRDLWNYNLGASVIYAASADIHLLLEWVGGWDETLRASGGLKHEFASLLIPGVRKAFDFTNGSQLVAGLGVPIGLTRSSPDIGAFLYFSFEHSFQKSD